MCMLTRTDDNLQTSANTCLFFTSANCLFRELGNLFKTRLQQENISQQYVSTVTSLTGVDERKETHLSAAQWVGEESFKFRQDMDILSLHQVKQTTNYSINCLYGGKKAVCLKAL